MKNSQVQLRCSWKTVQSILSPLSPLFALLHIIAINILLHKVLFYQNGLQNFRVSLVSGGQNCVHSKSKIDHTISCVQNISTVRIVCERSHIFIPLSIHQATQTYTPCIRTPALHTHAARGVKGGGSYLYSGVVSRSYTLRESGYARLTSWGQDCLGISVRNSSLEYSTWPIITHLTRIGAPYIISMLDSSLQSLWSYTQCPPGHTVHGFCRS